MEFVPVTSPTPWSIDMVVAFATDHESLVTTPGLVFVEEAASELITGRGCEYKGFKETWKPKTNRAIAIERL